MTQLTNSIGPNGSRVESSTGTGEFIIQTPSTGAIKFLVNVQGTMKGWKIDGTTGDLVPVGGSGVNSALANNSYLQSVDSTGLTFDDLIKADATDNTVLNAATGKAIKLSINGTADTTLTAGVLTFATASQKIVPGATSLLFQNNANNATNFSITDAGIVTVVRSNLAVTAGNLVFGAASAKITPGATSLLFTNNADNATNLSILDAGGATFRAGITLSGALVQTTGVTNPAIFGASTIDADARTGGALSTPDLVYLTNAAAGGGSVGSIGLIGTGAQQGGMEIDFFKTRSASATGDANTTAIAGDKVGRFLFLAANGTDYVNTAEILVTVDGAVGTGIIDFKPCSGAGALTSALKLSSNGLITVPTTVTAIGTTGNQTIDKTSGTVNIAGAGTTVTVTNALVTANSIVLAVIRTGDATAVLKNVIPGAGSFVINTTAAVTGTTSIGFVVINAG